MRKWNHFPFFIRCFDSNRMELVCVIELPIMLIFVDAKYVLYIGVTATGRASSITIRTGIKQCITQSWTMLRHTTWCQSNSNNRNKPDFHFEIRIRFWNGNPKINRTVITDEQRVFFESPLLSQISVKWKNCKAKKLQPFQQSQFQGGVTQMKRKTNTRFNGVWNKN